jgi:hypothetical protein
MLEVADIFRLPGPAYRQKFGDRMLPSHRRAMQDIETCRTESLGGQLYFCTQCQVQRYSYHSGKNRHCPKCQNEQANQWLQEQSELLLPTHHFLLTFTLPAELRAVARSNQKTIYNLLFRTSAAALQQLAQDPRFVGARLGMLGVLHTWTRQLLFHPHVHYIVTAGGVTVDGRWPSARKDFLVPVKALSPIFRAKFRDALKQTNSLLKYRPASGTNTGSCIPNQSPQACKPSSISPLTSSASLSATTASANWKMATLLSPTKSRPLINSSIAPSPPKSSSVASSNTSSHHASSRSVTTACSAPLFGNCY